MSTAPKVHMTCAVCHNYAGLFQQWHNRDNGYGVCAPCALWLTKEQNVGAEELERNYGKAGINYKATT